MLAPPQLAGFLLLILLLAWDNCCLIEGDSFCAGKRDKLVPGFFSFGFFYMDNVEKE